MTMASNINFKPYWVSESIPDLNEGARVDYQFLTRETATVAVSAGITSLYVGPKAATVTSVKDYQGSIAFSVSDGLLLFHRAVAGSGLLILEANPVDQVFSLLSGQIVPGLTLSSSGRLQGDVANIPGLIPRAYKFTLRVSDGTVSKDRRFVVTGIPKSSPSFWDFATVPPLSFDAVLENSFRRFGLLKRGEAFIHEIGINDADGRPYPRILVSQTGEETVSETVFDGHLPPGLTLDAANGLISGSVSVSAKPGRYVFNLSIEGETTVDPLPCLFEISPELAPLAAPPISIIWETPEGSLGVLDEGLPCPITLKASAVLGTPVRYSIVGLGSLPPGIVLDATTGMLLGRPRTNRAEVYHFEVRAAAGTVYEDRTFSVSIRNRLTAATLYDVDYHIMSKMALDLVEPYRSLIPASALFRPNDPAFGFQNDVLVEIIHNLAGSPTDEQLADYHDPTFLLLGPHKSAVARDSSGTILYEVIYRPLSDPNERAGGFTYRDFQPFEQRIIYPQARSTDIDYVFPNSIANLRADFVRDIGFGSADPRYVSKIGLNGNELLPSWMTSKQLDGSVLGYTPALVLAFVKPGESATILSRLDVSSEVPKRGHVVEFDRYFVSTRSDAETTFSDPAYRVLLIKAPQGTHTVQLGKWITLSGSIMVAEEGAYASELAYNKNLSTGEITFTALPRAAVLHVHIPSDPVFGSPAQSGFSGSVNAGPLTTGITSVVVDGQIGEYVRDDTETDILIEDIEPETEVLLDIGTVPQFDIVSVGRAIQFDLGEHRLSKYKKV